MKSIISYLLLLLLAIFLTKEIRPLLNKYEEASFILVFVSILVFLGLVFWKKTQDILKGKILNLYFVLANYVFVVMAAYFYGQSEMVISGLYLISLTFCLWRLFQYQRGCG
ncbi:MAG: hypothetical protein ACPGJV_14930 [Bacteriovoracaceae bacterium]